MTKGELMKSVYSKEELRNIDSAIPMEYWKTHETYWHVMNYNSGNGVLEDMREIGKYKLIPIDVVKLCVIDQSVNAVFYYNIDENWDTETIEAFLQKEGRHASYYVWGLYDEIVDLKEY